MRGFATAYRLSRWTARRFTQAGRTVGGVALATGVLGVDTTRTTAFQVFALATALLVCAWLPSWRWRPQVRVTRVLPDVATAGVPLAYRIRLEPADVARRGDLVLLDELVETLPDREQFRRAPAVATTNVFDRRVGYPRWIALLARSRGGSIAPTPVPRPAGTSMIETAIRFVPLRRGWIRFEAVRLLRPDPLGLVHAIATQPAPASLLVLPPVHPVPAIRHDGGRRHRPAGAQLVPQVGESQEFLQLRDYRPGDPMRRIHWPSSARTGRLVVKETGEEYFARIALVVDTFVAPDHEARLETVVTAAASLAAGLRLGDGLLDLMFVEDRVVTATVGRDDAGRGILLRALAVLEPATATDFATLANGVLERAAACSACVHVVLDWDEPRAALVRGLHALGIAQIVLVAGDIPGAQTAEGVPLHRLDPDDLAGSLAAMPVQCR